MANESCIIADAFYWCVMPHLPHASCVQLTSRVDSQPINVAISPSERPMCERGSEAAEPKWTFDEHNLSKT
eukprot:scaffold680596_cov53-Prasinocladus_malaysianus.AAC.2